MKAKAKNSEQSSPKEDSDSTPTASGQSEPSSKSSARARGLAGLLESMLGTTKVGSKPPPKKSPDTEAPELLDLLLEGPDAVVVVYRENGEIIEISDRLVDWTGIDRNELNGTLLKNLFPDTEQKIVRTLYEDAGAGGVHVVELPCRKPNSRSHLIEFTATKSKAGDGAFAILVGRDVGERAATERYLRAERDRLNTFIRSMRDSLVLLSPRGDILYANPATDLMFEPYELPVICHRWLAEFSKHDKTDLQGLTSAYGGQTMKLNAGDNRMFLVTRSFLFESGNRAMVMLMAKDITEQTLIEAQNHQLEIELIRESKLAEFGMLSAGIAHNLNGPLTGILGLCDLLKLRGQETKETLQVREQAQTMREIIANLLHKSRSEQEQEPHDLYIEDVIMTELRFLDANLFFKTQVEKIVELCDNAPPIFGVYIDVSQVIGNLLRNAIDAMHDVKKKVLTVKTSRNEKYLTVTVSDTGCGISEEQRKNLFKPFFTTKAKSGEAKAGEPVGTGLGLSSSRNILVRYGAEILVDSTPGGGTTFTVQFPLGRKPLLIPPK